MTGRLCPQSVALARAGLEQPPTLHVLVCFIVGASGPAQRKMKGGMASPAHCHTSPTGWLYGNLVVPSGGVPGPAPAAGVQCVQVQLLQVRASEPKGCQSPGSCQAAGRVGLGEACLRVGFLSFYPSGAPPSQELPPPCFKASLVLGDDCHPSSLPPILSRGV